MSPVMVAPLVALAALLAIPGRLPTAREPSREAAGAAAAQGLVRDGRPMSVAVVAHVAAAVSHWRGTVRVP